MFEIERLFVVQSCHLWLSQFFESLCTFLFINTLIWDEEFVLAH